MDAVPRYSHVMQVGALPILCAHYCTVLYSSTTPQCSTVTVLLSVNCMPRCHCSTVTLCHCVTASLCSLCQLYEQGRRRRSGR